MIRFYIYSDRKKQNPNMTGWCCRYRKKLQIGQAGLSTCRREEKITWNSFEATKSTEIKFNLFVQRVLTIYVKLKGIKTRPWMCTVTITHPVALFSLLVHIRVKQVVGGGIRGT